MLYGGNPGHIMNPLCAVQGRNPDSEIQHYLEACRVHRVEQRRERAAVTIDDWWISAREQCLPSLGPWRGRVDGRALWFDVEYTRLFRIPAEDIYVDVRYPVESGELVRVPFERPVDVSSDEFRTVDGNGRGPVAIPHDPCHYYPPYPFVGSTLTVGRDTGK